MPKRCSIDELRRMADLSDPRQVHMLAAVDAVAALVGDDHKKIMSALIGAYVTVAIASGHGDGMIKAAIENLELSRREFARAHLVEPGARRDGN